MDLDGSLMRSIVCCHVGRPTTFLNAALATEDAMGSVYFRFVVSCTAG